MLKENDSFLTGPLRDLLSGADTASNPMLLQTHSRCVVKASKSPSAIRQPAFAFPSHSAEDQLSTAVG